MCLLRRLASNIEGEQEAELLAEFELSSKRQQQQQQKAMTNQSPNKRRQVMLATERAR